MTTSRIHDFRKFVPPAWLLPGLFILFFLGMALWVFSATIDDAFISYRYAQNFIAGHGLVYNPGWERVEGFSNPLWVFWMVLVGAVHGNMLFISKVSGLAAALLAMWMTLRVARDDLKLNSTARLFLLGFLCTNFGLAFYSTGGMETTLFCLELSFLTWMLLKGRLSGILMGAAAIILTRPEGAMYACLALPCMMGLKRPRKEIVAACVFLLALCGGVTLLRLAYYGDWAPNAFYAKLLRQEFAQGHMEGAFRMFGTYATSFVLDYLGAGILFFPLCFGLVSFARNRILAPVLFLLAGVFFVFLAGGDWMAFSRFFIHFLPVIALVLAGGVDALYRLAEDRPEVKRILLGVLGAGLLISAGTGLYQANGIASDAPRYFPSLNSRVYTVMGKELKEKAQSGDRVVMGDLGAVGFYSELPIIDLYGLNSKDVARFRVDSNKTELIKYILEQRAEFLVIKQDRKLRWTTFSPWKEIHDSLSKDPEYRFVKTYFAGKNRRLHLYQRIKAS